MAYVIMSDDFVRLCEITKFKSIIWHELFLDSTGGDFEIVMSADKYFKYIHKGYYIVNTDSEKFGIIDTFEVTDTEEDGLIVKVSGLMGESILNRRVIWPTVNIVGPVDTVVGEMIRDNITHCWNVSRRIERFEYISNPEFDTIVSKQITGKNLGDAITSIVGQFGYGFVIRINDTFTGFEMRLIRGVDRSATQSENPAIIFSTDDYGIAEFRYLFSDKATFSHVVCAGEGSGGSRYAVIYPETSTSKNRGIHRREVFLDKKDLSRDDGDDSELYSDEYIAKLCNEAAEKLKESSTDEACEGIILPYRYKLYRDFLPGDIVTVRNERLGMEYDIRILGALISIDENGAADTTAEMGNLVIADIEDDPEEDEVDEGDEDVDALRISLSESVINVILNDGGDLTECASDGTAADAIGTPFGFLHIFDNERAEFVFTANTRYFSIPSTDNPTLGTLQFELNQNQGIVLTEKILEELNGMIIPVFLASGTSISPGFIKVHSPAAAKTTDANGNAITLFTANTTCYFGGVSGVYTLVASFVRALKTVWIPENYNPDFEPIAPDQPDNREFTLAWEKYTGLASSFHGYNIWSDGETLYMGIGWTLDGFKAGEPAGFTADASYASGQTMLDDFDARNVWTDGENIYYSSLGYQCVLNKETKHWAIKNWNGEPQFGDNIWHGDYIFYSTGTTQWALMDDGKWYNAANNWSGLKDFSGDHIWTDGEKIYYSFDTEHYVLNGWTWEPITWNGKTSFFGNDIWTAWGRVFLSNALGNQAYHYELNKETNTWEEIDWGFEFDGADVWTDGTNLYCSTGTAHYTIKKTYTE